MMTWTGGGSWARVPMREGPSRKRILATPHSSGLRAGVGETQDPARSGGAVPSVALPQPGSPHDRAGAPSPLPRAQQLTHPSDLASGLPPPESPSPAVIRSRVTYC